MGCAQASDANDDHANPRSIETQGDGDGDPTESDRSGEDCRSSQNAPRPLRGGTAPVAVGSPPMAPRQRGPLSPRTAPCSTDGVPAEDEDPPPPQHTPPANLKVWRCYYMVNGAKYPVVNPPQHQQQQVLQHPQLQQQPAHHVFPSTPPLQPHPTAPATPDPREPLMLPQHHHHHRRDDSDPPRAPGPPHAIPDEDDDNNDDARDDAREEKEAPSAPLLLPSLPSAIQQTQHLCQSPEKRPSPDKRPTPERYTIVQPCAPRRGSFPCVGGPGTSTAAASVLPYFHETNELLFGGGGGGQIANASGLNSIGEHYLLIESFTEEEEPMPPDGGSDLTPMAGTNRGSGDLDESHHRLLDAFPEGFICTTPEPPSTLNDDDDDPRPPPPPLHQQHPSALLARRTASGSSARNSGGGSAHHHHHNNHHGSPRRPHQHMMPHFRPLVSNMSGGSFTTTAGSTGGGTSASDGDCSASYVCRVSRSLPTDGEFVVRKKRR